MLKIGIDEKKLRVRRNCLVANLCINKFLINYLLSNVKNFKDEISGKVPYPLYQNHALTNGFIDARAQNVDQVKMRKTTPSLTAAILKSIGKLSVSAVILKV